MLNRCEPCGFHLPVASQCWCGKSPLNGPKIISTSCWQESLESLGGQVSGWASDLSPCFTKVLPLTLLPVRTPSLAALHKLMKSHINTFCNYATLVFTFPPLFCTLSSYYFHPRILFSPPTPPHPIHTHTYTHTSYICHI